MTGPASPTVRRRRLAAELRGIRESKGKSGDSVAAALKRWAGVDTPPKNRKDRAVVQSHFNAWTAETGRPLCQLSLILAASVED